MTNRSVHKVLLCHNGFEARNKRRLDTAEIILEGSLKAAGLEVTYNAEDGYDIVHLLDVSQYRAYQSLNKKRLSNPEAPIVMTLFNESFELSNDQNNDEVIKTNEIEKVYKNIKADEVICMTDAEALIIKHLNLFSSVDVCPIGFDYSALETLDEVEKSVFYRYFSLPMDAKIILAFGDYNLNKGLDDVKSAARLLPDYEFFFFGEKKGFNSDFSHFEKANKIINLHFESEMSLELIKSGIYTAKAAMFPYRFYSSPLPFLACMKGKVPIITAPNPFFLDFLVDKKTCAVCNSAEEYYKAIRDCESTDYIEQAYKNVAGLTSLNGGERLVECYNHVLSRK